MVENKRLSLFKNKKINLKKLIVIIIVLLVMISLIPWASSSYYGDGNLSDDKWVKVDDKVVNANIILSEYNNFIRQNYTMIQSNPLVLVQELNRIIGNQVSSLLLANEAESINLGVNEQLVLKLISKVPAFLDEDGNFSKTLFSEKIKNIGGNETAFIDDIKNKILEAQLLESVYPTINSPYLISKLDYLAINQNRTIEYVELTPDSVAPITEKPSDEVLQAILDENQSTYTIAEKRDAEVLFLNFNKLPTVQVSNTEVINYYNQNKNNYLNDETREVSQINFPDEATAKKVYEELKDKPIAEIKKAQNFISLGAVSSQQLPKELADPIFKAKNGALLSPLASNVGWHIFIVDKINAPSPKPLNQVKVQIKSDLLSLKNSNLKEEKRNAILEKLSSNTNLKDIATNINGSYYTLNDFSQFNTDNSSNDIKNNEEILNTLFAIAENKDSGLLEDKNGNFYVVKINKITPKKLQTLSEIKPTLIQVWKEQKEQEALKEKANQIILDLSNKKPINQVGLPVKTARLSLLSQDSRFSRESIDLLFSERKNKPLEGKLSNGNSFIAIVSNITVAKDNAKTKQEATAFNEYLKQNYVESLINVYIKSIETKYKIHVNEKAIINKLAPQQEN